MASDPSISSNNRSSLLRSIIIGGLIIGTFQFVIQLFLVSSLFYKNPFVTVMQYLSSSAIGNAAFQGSLTTALLGVIFHYFVSFVVAGVFILSADRIPVLRRHVIVGSLLYGIGVAIIMNFVVLPLSAAPSLPPPTPLQFLWLIIESALFIGLPLGILIRRSADIEKQ